VGQRNLAGRSANQSVDPWTGSIGSAFGPLRASAKRASHSVYNARRVVAETKPAAPFKLRRASFKSKGVRAGLRGASWGRLRDLAYEGRGA
jgi:hypothetical protein